MQTVNWPAWCPHVQAVKELQQWDDHQKAVQLVSSLDELPMNVAQEFTIWVEQEEAW